LIFLSLRDTDLAVARVAERVPQGGHNVPAEVVRRRFRTGLSNLLGCYRDIADSWQVYDNSDFEGPRLIASRGAGKPPAIADPGAWGNLKEPR
jgi:predicted ABC-type ATPase